MCEHSLTAVMAITSLIFLEYITRHAWPWVEFELGYWLDDAQGHQAADCCQSVTIHSSLIIGQSLPKLTLAWPSGR